MNPRLPAVNANLGWTYLHTKNYDEAVVYLKRALSYKPEYKHAMRGLARALFRKKDYKEALRYFRRIVEADPGAVGDLDCLGGSHLNIGNYDPAISAYRRVLSRKPRHQSALNGLGISLYRKESYPEALGHFQKLLAIKPKVPRRSFGNSRPTSSSSKPGSIVTRKWLYMTRPELSLPVGQGVNRPKRPACRLVKGRCFFKQVGRASCPPFAQWFSESLLSNS